MQNNTWKVLAILFMILFFLLVALNVWAYYSAVEEYDKTRECYYDYCSENPHADYINGICTCYDYDMIDGYMISKQKILK